MKSSTHITESKEEKTVPAAVTQDLSLKAYEEFYNLLLKSVDASHEQRLKQIRTAFKNYLLLNLKPIQIQNLYENINYLATEGFFVGKISPDILRLVLNDLTKQGEKLKILRVQEENEDFTLNVVDTTVPEHLKPSLVPERMQTGLSVEERCTVSNIDAKGCASLADTLVREGFALFQLRNYEAAITSFLSAIATIENSGLESASSLRTKLHILLVCSYQDYGNVAFSNNNFVEAAARYKLAIDVLDVIETDSKKSLMLRLRHNLANTHHHLGNINFKNNHFAEAIVQYETAIELLNNVTSEKKLLDVTFHMLGNTYGRIATRLYNENKARTDIITNLQLAIESFSKINTKHPSDEDAISYCRKKLDSIVLHSNFKKRPRDEKSAIAMPELEEKEKKRCVMDDNTISLNRFK